MTTTVKWVLSGLAAVLIAGAAYAVPALAEDRPSPMMSGGMGAMMKGGMGSMMNGDMMEMHNVMMPLMNEMPAMHNEMAPAMAKLLGMTPDELTKAMSEGKSMAQLAKEQGVAIGQVRAEMTKGMKSFLDRLTSEGKITAEQSGKMLGFMEKNMDSCLSGEMMKNNPMMKGMMNF